MQFIQSPHIPKMLPNYLLNFSKIIFQGHDIKINYSKPYHKAKDKKFRLYLVHCPSHIAHNKFLNEQEV